MCSAHLMLHEAGHSLVVGYGFGGTELEGDLVGGAWRESEARGVGLEHTASLQLQLGM